MKLYFRLLWISLVSKFRKKVPVFGPCLTPFRCMPTDLDVLRHMNNGVYFSIMDLARVDLMIRAGLAKKVADSGYYPVVVAETIKFRKSIRLFEAFHIETTLIGWDEKAFLLSQRFIKKDQCVAEAVVRARFLKRSGGSVLTSEILNLAEFTGVSPELPNWIKFWNSHQV